MTKISIIVPVYNVEKYLEKCLDSLVNQTLKEIEIIIVNDGTPDNSQEIINRYTNKYKNIKSYIKENGGLSDARNYGIKKATGEYIAFIDSDDYVDLKMMEIMYNHAIDNKLDIVVCDTINVYPDKDQYLISNYNYSDNNVKNYLTAPPNQQYLISNYNYSDNNVKNYLTAPPMACIRIYKRNLFNKISFKKGIYYEDLELTPKLVNQTKKIGFVNEGLYYYLQRTGSIMKQTTFNEKLLDIFKVLESNYKVLYKKYPEEIEYMYITHLLRTSTLRFLEYENSNKYINKIRKEIKDKFPKWKKNIYYKQSSKKLKIICNLAYYKQITVLKIIKKITNK